MIDKGDEVVIVYPGYPSWIGTVDHVPANVGDMWHIFDSEGKLHAINPNFSGLKEIVKIKEVKQNA